MLCCHRQTLRCAPHARVQRTWWSADVHAVLTLLSLVPRRVLQAWLKLVKGCALPTVNAFLVAVLLTIARVRRWETPSTYT